MLKYEFENYKSKGGETKMLTVECPYCHQHVAVDVPFEMESEREILTELAAELCTCPAAQLYQHKKERLEKLETALEQSVGSESNDPVDEEVFKVIHNVARTVCLEGLHKATIHLGKAEKINLKRDKNNFLVIERERKEVRTETV